MVAAQTPTLAKIKNNASEADARAILYIAICELCDFFNVGKNMNDVQVAKTVDLIIERFWHLKIEEIKYCFQRAMCRERLFDRLDGNIIIGWLREYDDERTEEAMRQSDHEASALANGMPSTCPGAITYGEYIKYLKARAEAGDTDARALLAATHAPMPQRMMFLTDDERSRKDREFQLWRMSEYLPSLKKNGYR